MNDTFFLILALVLGISAIAQGQPQAKFAVHGQNIEERASSRIGYWRTNVNAGLGEVVISYGPALEFPAVATDGATQRHHVAIGRQLLVHPGYQSAYPVG